MKTETSYGIIPLRRHLDFWEVLIVKHKGGHWSFPKGHPEINELPKETAERELFEETALKIERFLPCEPLQEQYWFKWQGTLIKKTVIYFLATVRGELNLQLKEVCDAMWCDIQKVESIVTFKQAKKICQEIVELVPKLNE